MKSRNDEFITLAYGRSPLKMSTPDRLVNILKANHVPGVPDTIAELRSALASPIDSPRIKDIASPDSRVAIIISDRTRIIPRREMILLVLEELSAVPDKNIVLVSASGNHPPSPIESLGLGDDLAKRFRFVSHDAMAGETISIGKTSAGIDVKINKAVAETDLKILVGQIKPHYFTGYSGGAKSILPGVSSFLTTGANHLMKSMPGARLGAVEGNPVRKDMEEAARLAGQNFMLNVVMNESREAVKAVAGDVVTAHREGVLWAKKVCEVQSGKAEIVVVSDGLPLSMNLYQAAKLVAPAARVLKPGGVIVLAAECHEGIGPLNIVNEVIYRMGLCPALPAEHRIILVSALPKERVAETFCEYSPGIEEALKTAGVHAGPSAGTIVIPKGGLVVPVE